MSMVSMDERRAPKCSAFVEFLRARDVVDGDGAQRMGGAATLRDVWVRSGLNGAHFARLVAEHFALPLGDRQVMRIAKPIADRLSQRFLRENDFYPVLEDDTFVLYAADPTAATALRATELALNAPAKIRIATYEDIDAMLSGLSKETERADGIAQLQMIDDAPAASEEVQDSLREMAQAAPAVRAVEELLELAVTQRATDIHLEVGRDSIEVRLRVDGMLRRVRTYPSGLARGIVSRVKILSQLDIAERRRPQDGRARVTVGSTELELRVATMPALHGENAVIRLLERDHRLLDMSRLGLTHEDTAALRRQLDAPFGLFIVTGPTGSGKTTTLASALSILNEPHRNIVTIEDPIEYQIPGVNQSQVKPQVGLDFASALRHFVRQDPDVIMVGEIRDRDTAQMAVQAALTGHLVLTTLHTNSAAGAIPRLIDLGVESFLLTSTLRCVVGQRLVRVLCKHCRKARVLTAHNCDQDPRLEALGLTPGIEVFDAVGCDWCGGSGYQGRVGVFEVLEVTHPIRAAITPRCDSQAIEKVARDQGMTTIIADGVGKCRHGTTSLNELVRVLMSL
jgi:general secretion pathway protein E